MEKQITLLNKVTGQPEQYGFDHARAILIQDAYMNYNDFSLPETSEYVFQNGNLIKRPTPQPVKSPAKQG